MKSLLLFCSLLACAALAAGGRATAEVPPPAPYGPVPTPAQMAWHRRELIAFVHFNMNTFTGAEWGQRNEDPKLFHPAHLDCDQWIRALKTAGITEMTHYGDMGEVWLDGANGEGPNGKKQTYDWARFFPLIEQQAPRGHLRRRFRQHREPRPLGRQ